MPPLRWFTSDREGLSAADGMCRARCRFGSIPIFATVGNLPGFSSEDARSSLPPCRSRAHFRREGALFCGACLELASRALVMSRGDIPPQIVLRAPYPLSRALIFSSTIRRPGSYVRWALALAHSTTARFIFRFGRAGLSDAASWAGVVRGLALSISSVLSAGCAS